MRQLPVLNESSNQLTDCIKLPRLRGNITCWEPQALVEIVCLAPINQLRNRLSIPVVVELVYQHAMELRQILDDTNDDVQQLSESRRASELVVNLREDREHVQGGGG